MQFRDGGERECVADVFFVSANPALAEHDLRVALGHDVFGGEEEFFERSAHAALEEDGFGLLADGVEQIKILHVACADLQDIRVIGDEFDLIDRHDFGDD